MQLTYSIYYPGGNTTALVNQLILDPILKRKINAKIMALYPLVEQVGFINAKNYRLEMAGGEFCGNATRCAAFFYLKGQSGKIKIQVSGVNKKLSAGVNEQKNVWTQIPLLDPPTTYKLGYTLINIEGITQVIIPRSGNKTNAEKILSQLNLLKSIPAAGVIFVTKNQSIIKLDPFVYVRDIKTFFNETACASGTAAAGYYLARKLNRAADFSILQPSKQILNVSVQLKPLQVKISGQVKIIKKNLSITL